MLEKKLVKNKGITLIALVVTIIVLLILAGISIAMLTGQNGILTNAGNAKKDTEEVQIEEKVKLSVGDALTQGQGELEDENLKNALNSYIGKDNYEITENKENGWVVTIKTNKKSYKISSTGSIKNVAVLPTRKEVTEPYLPSDDFEMDEETSLDTGLVIKDSIGNEYVWVEVPKTDEVYPTAGTKITSFTTDEYTKIETDLHTYTNAYRKGTSNEDVYSADNEDGWFPETGEKSYDKAKKKMLRSVYEHGGFWVGRYEAGIEKNRTAAGNVTTTPLIQANLYPYTYVTRTQAKVLAEQVESGNCTSSLLFGVQWDLVLKYMNRVTDESNLIVNSTKIGNYCESEWNITNKLVQYSENYGKDFIACPQSKEYGESIALTTGADKSFSLMNIYDIAGNIWEWTLENTSNKSSHCVFRGGSYCVNGSIYTASDRGDSYSPTNNFSSGFRISLY